MYLQTLTKIKRHHDASKQWCSSVNIYQPCKSGDYNIDLSPAISSKPETPRNAPRQPAFHPLNSRYCFDTQSFKGLASKDDLVELLKQSTSGCNLVVYKSSKDQGKIELRCTHYLVHHHPISNNFSSPNLFQKDNCKIESVKMVSSDIHNAFSRMENPKMRSRPPKHTVDRRRQPSKSPTKSRRTLTSRAICADTRCKFVLKVFMDETHGTWHLHSKSNLEHNDHVPLSKDGALLTKNDLNETQTSMLKVLYDNGVSPSIIAKTMKDVVLSESGKQGEFLPKTIHNIVHQDKRALDAVKGMKSHWSEAQLMLKNLDE